LSESVVGAGDVGITDIIKSDGALITEVFNRIDMTLKRLKPLVSINSEDPVQSELPVESAITADLDNTTYCENIFDDKSEVERSDILKFASLLISGGARRQSYRHPTGSDTNKQNKKRTKQSNRKRKHGFTLYTYITTSVRYR
jgi:hypothetical protein